MSPTFTSFVFVDFENVSAVDLALVAGQPVHVTLLIGKNQKKLDLGLVKQIHQFAAQVELVELAGSGRNALDMTLAYYLGRAVERFPSANFCVVSKDKDFEPMLEHLRAAKIQATRVDAFGREPEGAVAKKPLAPAAKKTAVRPAKKTPPATPPSRAAVKPAMDRGEKILRRLRDGTNKSRPATQAGMLAHIKNALGKTAAPADSEKVLKTLVDEGTLTIEAGGKIFYR